MAIADDFSVDTSGNIRYTGTTDNYTVLELHRFLQDLADDAQASGNDLVDITVDTPSDRSTDQIITLNSPFNIDDTAARHLYDGSITQSGGDTVYSGLQVVGTVETGTEPMILQDDEILPSYWGTGINVDAANLLIMQIMVKTRDGGADIDGKRVLVMGRELGDTYQEFPVTLGLANSVAAISTAADLNNATADATIEGWTTITNVEGFQLIDIDGDSTGEEYYSQWDIGSQTINDTYERAKWISQRAHNADSSGDQTGTDFVVDNATILGQGQEFSARAQNEKLVEMRFDLKVGGGTPVGTLVAELYLSDDAGAGLAEPTGAVLATSEPVLVSVLQSTYQEIIFRFNDNVTMTASEDYFAVIRNADGDGTNFVHVRGSTSGSDDGNRAEDTGTWAATAADDLEFTVRSCPIHHEIAGEKFRGITTEIVYDNEAGGPFTEDEVLFWGARLPYDGIASGPFVVGTYAVFKNGGVAVNAGKILKQTATMLWVALEDTAGDLISDNDTIEVVGAATTAAVNFPAVTGNGTDDLDFTAGANTIDRTAGSFVADGYEVGQAIDVTGSASNNGTFTLTAVAALQLTTAEALVTESNVAATVTVAARDDTQSSGEGILLALDDNGAAGDFYIQRISGTNPVDNAEIEGRTSGATADVNATITGRTISTPFIGASTGSNIIGAYGIGFQPADVGASDTFFDLGNVQRTPPNNVTFTVTGLVSGEDRVLVGPRQAGVLDRDQLQTDTTLSAATETLIQCSTAIPTDTPTSGTGADNTRVRVELDTGIYRRVQYDSYTANDFTITTGPDDDWTGANVSTQPKDVFVAYIDVLADATSEAYTAVYSSDRDLFVRVRDGGATPIKTFETPATFGSTSSSVAAIRTSDA